MPPSLLLNGHDPIVFDLRLKMSILRRFLPKRVNFRFPAFLHHLRKARRFDFEQLHEKKSARELRQGGSDYRCCIPALAGFVSPQSIAPDGEEKFAQDRHRAIGFCLGPHPLTAAEASGCIDPVRSIALLALVLLQCSCTTLVNRRDLYSPEPDSATMPPGVRAAKTAPAPPAAGPRPEFR